ncbi:MAG: hypothetical protein E7223_02700 [Clostridiales bacterium]|nr:hypothetical protein [Clostridiales bacterium]
MNEFLLVLIATIVLLVGFQLQRKLSAKENVWLGLIIPFIMMVITILSLVFGMEDGYFIILGYLVFMLSMIFNAIFIIVYIYTRAKRKQKKKMEERLAEIEAEEAKKLGLHPNQKKKMKKMKKLNKNR